MKMNLFRRTSFSWWELGMLKWASAFIGIAIGSTWPAAFAGLSLTLLILGLLMTSYLGLVWYRQRRRKSSR